MSVLIACRKEAGLTQEEFGERCGRDQKWVSAIETGRQNVLLSDLPMLAEAYRIDPIVFVKRYLAFLGK
jgi:transcriptional regulator with XRE-family HTH domain